VSAAGAGTQGTIWVRGAVPPVRSRAGAAAQQGAPEWRKDAPRVSRRRRLRERGCNAEPKKTAPGRATTGIPGFRGIAHRKRGLSRSGKRREG